MLSPLPSARTFFTAPPLHGAIAVPGDKSISHRALILAALAVGESVIHGLLEGEDVIATAEALRAMGVGIRREALEAGKPSREEGEASGAIPPAVWRVDGVGVGGLLQPGGALNMGNSGTSTRLLMGLIASHRLTATLIGDASLSRRPMARVIEPLSQMGATFSTAPGERLPLTMTGRVPAVPIRWRMPVASAQLKSALLLAGLNTPGTTTVVEPVPTRDHSERMLKACGAMLSIEMGAQGERIISLTGEAELNPFALTIPGDPSSAAFAAVAALIVPGSEITVYGVGLNPTRDGLYRLLEAMGARIERVNPREIGGEPVADLRVRHSVLTGVDVPVEIIPSMIDEFPILFVAAAFAQGRTRITGLDELRVKESDRIAVMADGLRAVGARVEELADGMVIDGTGGEPLPGGGRIATHLDHRIAMSFAVCALACRAPVEIDDIGPIATSYPAFLESLTALGAPQAAPC